MIEVTITVTPDADGKMTEQEQDILRALAGGSEWPPEKPKAKTSKPAEKKAEKPAPKPEAEPKVEKSPKPAEKSEPTPDETPAETPGESGDSASLTLDDARRVAQEALKLQLHDQVREVLKELDAARVTELKEKDIPTFVDRVQKLVDEAA